MPAFSPPYYLGKTEFSAAIDVTMISISYYVAASHILHLIPTTLEVEDEPVVTSRFIRYGMSPVGPYNEFIQQVEVTHRDEKFDFSIVLILDNESAVFIGRELFGFPKLFVHIDLQLSNSSRLMIGSVERPPGRPIVTFEFEPEIAIDVSALQNPPPRKRILNQKSIPSPDNSQIASIQELVAVVMKTSFSTVWMGKGSVNFPEKSAMGQWSNVDILRYKDAAFVQNARAQLCPQLPIPQSRL